MTLQSTIEAMLFAVGAPITIARLSELTGESEETVRKAAESLKEKLAPEDSGIQLIQIEDGYQLCTKSEAGDFVKRALELKKAPPLSKASLEVLAIIAYNQPVTRGFIEQVRGIESSYIVAGLQDKGLICEQGQLDAPGRPVLFGTTDAFLRCFGLESLADLPETELPNPEQMTIPEGGGETEDSEKSEDAGKSESDAANAASENTGAVV